MHFSANSRIRRDVSKRKFKVMGEHSAFLARIKKSLYYGKLPVTERFSLPVSEFAAEIFSEIKNGKSLDRLDIEEAAALSRNACVSPCSLVLALLYLERLKSCNSDYLQRVAPSELFLVSMMIASKFLHDDGEEDEVFNDEWATSAGLDVKEVNQFEKEFLNAISWEVFVSEESFWSRLHSLERDIALREGKRRGWFSYSDLDHLLEVMDLASVAQTVLSVSAVCLTSYTASVLTLIGSAFIVSQIPGNSISTSISSAGVNSAASMDQILDSMPFTSTPAQSSLAILNGLSTNLVLLAFASCAGVTVCNNDKISDQRHKLEDEDTTSGLDHIAWPKDICYHRSTNGSCENNRNAMDWEANGLITNSFVIETSSEVTSISYVFLEWLTWARTFLDQSNVSNHVARSWPVEISASC